MDWELITMILVVLGGVIAFRLIYKLFARHRILRVIIIGVLCIGIISMIFMYVYNNRDTYSNSRAYYIYGKVKVSRTSMNEIDVDSVRTSLIEGGKGRIIVKVPEGTKIYQQVGNGKEQEISLKDVRFGDTVQVLCKEKATTNDKMQVTATKIIKKAE